MPIYIYIGLGALSSRDGRWQRRVSPHRRAVRGLLELLRHGIPRFTNVRITHQ